MEIWNGLISLFRFALQLGQNLPLNLIEPYLNKFNVSNVINQGNYCF